MICWDPVTVFAAPWNVILIISPFWVAFDFDG